MVPQLGAFGIPLTLCWACPCLLEWLEVVWGAWWLVQGQHWGPRPLEQLPSTGDCLHSTHVASLAYHQSVFELHGQHHPKLHKRESTLECAAFKNDDQTTARKSLTIIVDCTPNIFDWLFRISRSNNFVSAVGAFICSENSNFTPSNFLLMNHHSLKKNARLTT